MNPSPRHTDNYRQETARQSSRSVGNIAPYRKDLCKRVLESCPDLSEQGVKFRLVLKKDGELIEQEILTSSGNPNTDETILKALKTTAYAPLPDWYKGEQLTFVIDCSSGRFRQR